MIEDNVDGANSLKDLLEIDGHEVEVAYTGPEGVEAARRFRPEVVLCDLGLPGMDGYAVARELRDDPATAQAQLIALTGYGKPEDQERSRDAGFEAHLVKPLEFESLNRLLA